MPPLIWWSFPVMLAATQFVFLHRFCRPSSRFVPAATVSLAIFVIGIATCGGMNLQLLAIIAPIAVPLCLTPMLSASGFRAVLIWPMWSLVGVGCGAAVLFGFAHNPSTIVGFAIVGVCYGVVGQMGLIFPREDDGII